MVKRMYPHLTICMQSNVRINFASKFGRQHFISNSSKNRNNLKIGRTQTNLDSGSENALSPAYISEQTSFELPDSAQ
jgi:hypothetical protein